MAENDNKNGKSNTQNPAGAPPQIQVKILNQYIKDLSFENPNIHKLINGPGEKPNISIEVSVNADHLEKDIFESTVAFKAVATNNHGTIYVLETVYAGLFKIESMPQQALEPFLLVSGPSTIFPYLRRLIADVTREGGFPPLLLDPIDFAGLYLQRQQQQQQAQEKPATA
jgi:preprotein translocase subunit SecB